MSEDPSLLFKNIKDYIEIMQAALSLDEIKVFLDGLKDNNGVLRLNSIEYIEYAIALKRDDVLQYIIQSNSQNALIYDKVKGSALHIAAHYKDLEILRYLVKLNKIDPNYKDIHGNLAGDIVDLRAQKMEKLSKATFKTIAHQFLTYAKIDFENRHASRQSRAEFLADDLAIPLSLKRSAPAPILRQGGTNTDPYNGPNQNSSKLWQQLTQKMQQDIATNSNNKKKVNNLNNEFLQKVANGDLNKDQFERYLNDKVNPNSVDFQGNSALHLAIENGDINSLALLVGRVDLRIKNLQGDNCYGYLLKLHQNLLEKQQNQVLSADDEKKLQNYQNMLQFFKNDVIQLDLKTPSSSLILPSAQLVQKANNKER